MRELDIDLECFSGVDLVKAGLYRYSESDDFEILLFAYSADNGPVQVVDIALGEKIPDEILAALSDEDVAKWAHNSSFERICLSAYLRKHYPQYFRSYSVPEDTVGNYLNPSSWYCSMIWASYLGLPKSLKGIGAVLKLDEQKMDEGKELIRYFCMPCRPTKKNGGRLRNFPHHCPEKWAVFKEYNKRDVEVELAIKAKLARFPVPDFIWDEYHLDQEINDRGILVDMTLVEHAIAIDEKTKEALRSRMRETTGLENPNSVMQMKGWLAQRGIEAESLDKKAVKEMLPGADTDVATALSCRQQLAKSSISKYSAIRNSVCADGRVRGMYQFYGANRTGRWAGKIVQMQNLAQNHMEDLAEARELVRDGNYTALELLYDNIPNVLSELIRTAFVPKPGYKLIVSDFSAIEARVLSFLAGEQWRIDLFAKGGDIYCQAASKMFGVPVEKNGVNGHLRQKGKIAELACIAEGQLVLTDKGLVPIEKVTKEHRLWDGDSWVSHSGMVFKGEREVILYDGLAATPDHMVWVEGKQEPVQLRIAAASGARLLRTGADVGAIYCPSPARVYDILNAGERHRYTVSGRLVHNCGYGGSVGALKAMGALEMGLTEDELQPLVTAWREANPRITRFWWDIDTAAKTAVRDRTTVFSHGFKFRWQSGMLFIGLPSGRRLVYVKPRIDINRFGGEAVTYEGMNLGKWTRLETYGPKITENIVQAVSRDILAYAMKTLRHCFIVGSVHDELIIECSPGVDLGVICEQMGRTPPWIMGLGLRADGYECGFYKKE